MLVLAQADPTAADVGVSLVVMGVLVIISIAIYFIPSVIAAVRNHQNGIAIFALNFLLGWTFIGWVAALVWSLTAVETRRR